MNPGAVVFDCMVFVQAFTSRGTAYRCYEFVTRSGIDLLASDETLGELQTVLNRPELQRKLPGITEERVQALMHHLRELVTFVDLVPQRFAFPPDPKDEPYLNLAIVGNASNLVTRDKALLRLSSPDDLLASSLREVSPILRLVLPEAYLSQAKPETIP